MYRLRASFFALGKSKSPIKRIRIIFSDSIIAYHNYTVYTFPHRNSSRESSKKEESGKESPARKAWQGKPGKEGPARKACIVERAVLYRRTPTVVIKKCRFDRHIITR